MTYNLLVFYQLITYLALFKKKTQTGTYYSNYNKKRHDYVFIFLGKSTWMAIALDVIMITSYCKIYFIFLNNRI